MYHTAQVFPTPVQNDIEACCSVRYGGDRFPLLAWVNENPAYLEYPLSQSSMVEAIRTF